MDGIINIVKTCLIASIEAYDDKLLPMYNFSEFKPIRKFDIEGVQFFMGQRGESESDILIVFRGSDEIIDYLRDMKLRKKVIPYGGVNPKIKVHTGFIQAYKKIREIMHDNLNKENPKRIFITGHSLGGALATLCAVDIDYNMNDDFGIDITCIVFGCPKVGNKEFVQSYDSRITEHFRIVNGSDIVPHLPRWWQNYWHVGREYLYGKHTPKFYWELIKKGKIITALKTLLIGTINDHFRKSYLTIVDEI